MKYCTVFGDKCISDDVREGLIKAVKYLLDNGTRVFFSYGNGDFVDALYIVIKCCFGDKDIEIYKMSSRYFSSSEINPEIISYREGTVLITPEKIGDEKTCDFNLLNWLIDKSDNIICYAAETLCDVSYFDENYQAHRGLIYAISENKKIINLWKK